MKSLFLIAAVAFCQVYGEITTPTLSACNPDVIRWVKVTWDANGSPSGLVSGRKDAQIGMIGSSEDYNVTGQCQSAVFSGDSATWSITNEKGEKASYKETFVEDPKSPGVVTSNDGKVVRYFVFAKDGVNAFYVCSTDGPKGKPQGGISVPLAPLDDHTWDMVDYAAARLSYVGVSVKGVDVDKCFPQSN